MEVELQPRNSDQKAAPQHQKGHSADERVQKRRKREKSDASLAPGEEDKLEEKRKEQKDNRYATAAQVEASYCVLRRYLNKPHQQRHRVT